MVPWEDSTILVTGASGFLGKAVLAALLARDPAPRRLLLLLRAADAEAAQRRLREEVLGSQEGAAAAVAARLLEQGRLAAVPGDLAAADLAAAGTPVWGEVTTAIHCAASVSFEDPLDEILPLNAFGPVRLLESLREAGARPHFVHVSTAYAADCRRPLVPEDGPLHPDLAGLDPEAMLAAARGWRQQAEGRGGDAARELASRGRRHAVACGWPDTYALTKALGERLLCERSELTTIVRPTIIESALSRPRPGWLEGIKVADPLILAYAAGGLTHLSGRLENRIDVVPVDLVANACVAAALQPPARSPRALAVASTSRNPLTLGELAAQIKAYFRREPLQRGGKTVTIGELRFVSRRAAVGRAAARQRLAASAAALAPPPLRRGLGRNARLAAQLTRMVAIYAPYTELDCAFDDANARRLAAELSPADRAVLPFDTAALDWDSYLQETHLPEVRRMAMSPRG